MKSFRNERLQAFSSRRAFRSAPAMRDVAFSASQPHELAFETRGLGDFTRRALRVLDQGRDLTNQAFHNAVVAAFGQSRRQPPYFDAPDWAHDQPLLAPYPVEPEDEPVVAPGAPPPLSRDEITSLVSSVQAMNEKLDALLKRL
ncbi:MAG: hypothetical protein AAGF99_12665, partial [Bacteroidota bacterium]